VKQQKNDNGGRRQGYAVEGKHRRRTNFSEGDAVNATSLIGTSAVSAGSIGGSLASAATGQQTAATPFASLFNDAVGTVNSLEDQAHAAVSGLMSGNGVDVHEAMIAVQKSSMAFELALSVRNKAVQAYQQVIGMQF
jgi:flagellar hook-basal body complex protein FliE